MNPATQQELNTLIRTLQGVSDVAKRDTGRILTEAAGPLRAAIAGRAPRSEKPHKRYKNGKVVAVYQPGNLSKSFSVLSFRRAKFAKFVGPKLDKTGGGKTPDGYYAHMVEFGTVHQPGQHFVEAGVAAAGGLTLNIATTLMQRTLEKAARSKGLSWGQRYEAATGR